MLWNIFFKNIANLFSLVLIILVDFGHCINWIEIYQPTSLIFNTYFDTHLDDLVNLKIQRNKIVRFHLFGTKKLCKYDSKTSPLKVSHGIAQIFINGAL